METEKKILEIYQQVENLLPEVLNVNRGIGYDEVEGLFLSTFTPLKLEFDEIPRIGVQNKLIKYYRRLKIFFKGFDDIDFKQILNKRLLFERLTPVHNSTVKEPILDILNNEEKADELRQNFVAC